ncbi:MAG TPA: MoaD/ThiS family protein [Chthoniobacterales bacterium]
MKVRVQFFSRLRDLVGEPAIELEVAQRTTAGELLDLLYAKTPALRDWDKSILVAAGVEFVERNYALKPGDEISIMPPVQGG